MIRSEPGSPASPGSVAAGIEGTAAPPADAGPGPGAAPRYLDPVYRIVTILVAIGLGGVSASYEALLSPLYWHGWRLPLALLLAVIGNPLLIWFTYLGTGRLLALLAPVAPWLAVMLLGASRTTEGDLLLTGDNWVAFATLFAGSIAFAGAVVPLMRYAAPLGARHSGRAGSSGSAGASGRPPAE